MPAWLIGLAVIAVLLWLGVQGADVGNALGQAARFILEGVGGLFEGLGDPGDALG